MKNFTFCLFFFALQGLFGQGIFYIRPEDSKLYIRNVVHLSSESGLGVANKLPVLSCVMSDSARKQYASAIFNFDPKGKVQQSVMLGASGARVQLAKHLLIGGDNYALYGTVASTALGYSNDFLYQVNLKNGTSSVVQLASNQSLAQTTNAIDMVGVGRKIYLLGQGIIPFFDVVPKVVLRSLDTSQLVASSVTVLYPADVTSGLLATNIENLPNGNVLIGGTVNSKKEGLGRPLLCELDASTLKVVRSKQLNLWNSNQTKELNCSGMIVRKNAGRYFGFTQTFDTINGVGQLYSIMFDTLLNVLTWRNYELPFKMESAIVDAGYFWVSGATIANRGYPGYATLKINASNAIIEKIYYYPNFLKNENLNTSAVSLLESTTREPLLCAVPEGQSERSVAIVWRADAMGQPMCDSTFAYTVFKSPIFEKDYPLVSEQLINPSFFASNLVVEKLNFATLDQCVKVSTLDNLGTERLEIVPNPTNGAFQVFSDKQIDKILVYDILGNLIHQSSFENNQIVDIVSLTNGLYIATFMYKGSVVARAKFQVLK